MKEMDEDSRPWWKQTLDNRDVDTSLLENSSTLDHTRSTLSSVVGSNPRVVKEPSWRRRGREER